MNCPQCLIADIDSSGKCPVCGHQVPASVSVPGSDADAKDSSNLGGMIEMDYSEGTQDSQPKEEVPQWRKDLAKRLQEIKLKKEATVASGPMAQTAGNNVQAPESQSKPTSLATKAKLIENMPIRKAAPKPLTPVPRQKALQPIEPETVVAKAGGKTGTPQDIHNLIDAVVSRQSAPDNHPARPIENAAAEPERFAESEGKLILLSRTLSGLIDLICIVICTVSFVLAADFCSSGIVMLDFISWMNFSALLLMTYFVYSVFFIAASNQTIGMMITDLRVVGFDRGRPPLARLIARCCCHLVSLLALGIGLLWSLFNRENLCLHDRLSKTMIVRS